MYSVHNVYGYMLHGWWRSFEPCPWPNECWACEPGREHGGSVRAATGTHQELRRAVLAENRNRNQRKPSLHVCEGGGGHGPDTVEDEEPHGRAERLSEEVVLEPGQVRVEAGACALGEDATQTAERQAADREQRRPWCGAETETETGSARSEAGRRPPKRALSFGRPLSALFCTSPCRPPTPSARRPPFANAHEQGRAKAMSRAPASASALARRGVKRKRADDADDAPLVAFYSERGSFARVLSRASLRIPGARGVLTRDLAMRRRIARRAPRRRAQ
jgi:hypothetical protein